MGFYILRRLLLMIPTLIGIMVVNFIIIQAAPGGPIERIMAQMQGIGGENSIAESAPMQNVDQTNFSGHTWDPALVNDLKKLYGFDKPPVKRFFLMMKNYLTFNFGESYFKNASVLDLILQKLPVSISIGLWTTLLIYLISIPLGIAKAVKNGTPFDSWTSFIMVIGYAIPSFLFALTLLILFAGGSFWSWFPLRGLTSANWATLSFFGKIKDYFWHLTLPITAQVISGFASLMLLTKNSFLEEIHKNYVITARSQGLSEKAILFRHIFRNAMLVVIAGLPATLLHIFFSGSLLIEMIFSLDGLGLLSFESIMNRDYPVVFGSLYIFTIIGLFLHLLSDLLYTWIDPRIDFQKRFNG